jgi:hypothetical protein
MLKPSSQMMRTITTNIGLIVHIAAVAVAEDEDESLGTVVLHSREEISVEDNNSNDISRRDVTSAREQAVSPQSTLLTNAREHMRSTIVNSKPHT